MQRFKGIGTYGTVGLDMAVAVLLGFLAGRWADQKLGARGWPTIVGVLLGIAVAFNMLFKAAKRLRQETEREDRRLEQHPERGEPKDGDGGDGGP
jgi:F0F1-type ATP synthase assembly protein I